MRSTKGESLEGGPVDKFGHFRTSNKLPMEICPSGIFLRLGTGAGIGPSKETAPKARATPQTPKVFTAKAAKGKPVVCAHRSFSRFLIASLTLAILAGGYLSATTLRPLNLEDLTRKAGRIVVGRCISVEKVTHPKLGIPVEKVTLRVERMLKGRGGRTLTFQVASAAGGDLAGAGVAGIPRFRAGEKLLLFLYPEGRSGLTSAVGLGQGKFLRRPDKNGKEVAVNGFGNRSLLKGLSAQAAKKIGVDESVRHKDRLDRFPSADLIRMVEELAP